MAGLDWSDETVAVGGANLVVQKAGSGPPLVILHEELGCPGTVSWQETIAQSRTLVVPQHPGFGRSERAEWIVCVRDLACLYAMYLRKQKLAPAAVIGFSFGGWIAAEMAANDPALFSKLVLVGAHGIKPPEGEILDQFMLTADEYLRQSVVDPSATDEFLKLYGGEITPEQYEAFEEARAETARLAWKPFMFNPRLGASTRGSRRSGYPADLGRPRRRRAAEYRRGLQSSDSRREARDALGLRTPPRNRKARCIFVRSSGIPQLGAERGGSKPCI